MLCVLQGPKFLSHTLTLSSLLKWRASQPAGGDWLPAASSSGSATDRKWRDESVGASRRGRCRCEYRSDRALAALAAHCQTFPGPGWEWRKQGPGQYRQRRGVVTRDTLFRPHETDVSNYANTGGRRTFIIKLSPRPTPDDPAKRCSPRRTLGRPVATER